MPIIIEGSENRPFDYQKYTRFQEPVGSIESVYKASVTANEPAVVFDWRNTPYGIEELSADLRKDDVWGYIRQNDIVGESGWWPLSPKQQEVTIENLRFKLVNILFEPGEPDTG